MADQPIRATKTRTRFEDIQAHYEGADADDPMVTFELTDHVRETIQQTLYQLLAGRRNMFFG